MNRLLLSISDEDKQYGWPNNKLKKYMEKQGLDWSVQVIEVKELDEEEWSGAEEKSGGWV